jgi:hypothetical protein
MYHRLSCLERPLVGWDRRFGNEVRGNLQTVSEKSAETSGLSEPEGLPDAESGDSDTLLATPIRRAIIRLNWVWVCSLRSRFPEAVQGGSPVCILHWVDCHRQFSAGPDSTLTVKGDGGFRVQVPGARDQSPDPDHRTPVCARRFTASYTPWDTEPPDGPLNMFRPGRGRLHLFGFFRTCTESAEEPIWVQGDNCLQKTYRLRALARFLDIDDNKSRNRVPYVYTSGPTKSGPSVRPGSGSNGPDAT